MRRDKSVPEPGIPSYEPVSLRLPRQSSSMAVGTALARELSSAHQSLRAAFGSLSGRHQLSFARYQSIVSAKPRSKDLCG